MTTNPDQGSDPVNVVIYDQGDGTVRGLDSAERVAACYRRATTRKWTVAGLYVDNPAAELFATAIDACHAGARMLAYSPDSIGNADAAPDGAVFLCDLSGTFDGDDNAELLTFGSWLDKGRTVVLVDGFIDVYTCPRFRDELVSLTVLGQRLLAIDMEAVRFMDSSGLGVLIGAVKRAKGPQGVDGAVALVHVPETIMRILRITGLSQVFPVFPNMAEAFAYLDSVSATVPAR